MDQADQQSVSSWTSSLLGVQTWSWLGGDASVPGTSEFQSPTAMAQKRLGSRHNKKKKAVLSPRGSRSVCSSTENPRLPAKRVTRILDKSFDEEQSEVSGASSRRCASLYTIDSAELFDQMQDATGVKLPVRKQKSGSTSNNSVSASQCSDPGPSKDKKSNKSDNEPVSHIKTNDPFLNKTIEFQVEDTASIADTDSLVLQAKKRKKSSKRLPRAPKGTTGSNTNSSSKQNHHGKKSTRQKKQIKILDMETKKLGAPLSKSQKKKYLKELAQWADDKPTDEKQWVTSKSGSPRPRPENNSEQSEARQEDEPERGVSIAEESTADREASPPSVTERQPSEDEDEDIFQDAMQSLDEQDEASGSMREVPTTAETNSPKSRNTSGSSKGKSDTIILENIDIVPAMSANLDESLLLRDPANQALLRIRNSQDIDGDQIFEAEQPVVDTRRMLKPKKSILRKELPSNEEGRESKSVQFEPKVFVKLFEKDDDSFCEDAPEWLFLQHYTDAFLDAVVGGDLRQRQKEFQEAEMLRKEEELAEAVAKQIQIRREEQELEDMINTKRRQNEQLSQEEEKEASESIYLEAARIIYRAGLRYHANLVTKRQEEEKRQELIDRVANQAFNAYMASVLSPPPSSPSSSYAEPSDSFWATEPTEADNQSDALSLKKPKDADNINDASSLAETKEADIATDALPVSERDEVDTNDALARAKRRATNNTDDASSPTKQKAAENENDDSLMEPKEGDAMDDALSLAKTSATENENDAFKVYMATAAPPPPPPPPRAIAKKKSKSKKKRDRQKQQTTQTLEDSTSNGPTDVDNAAKVVTRALMKYRASCNSYRMEEERTAAAANAITRAARTFLTKTASKKAQQQRQEHAVVVIRRAWARYRARLALAQFALDRRVSSKQCISDAAGLIRRAWINHRSRCILQTRITEKRRKRAAVTVIHRSLSWHCLHCTLNKRIKEKRKRQAAATVIRRALSQYCFQSLLDKRIQQRQLKIKAIEMIHRVWTWHTFQQVLSERIIEKRVKKDAAEAIVRAWTWHTFHRALKRRIEETEEKRAAAAVISCAWTRCSYQRMLKRRSLERHQNSAAFVIAHAWRRHIQHRIESDASDHNLEMKELAAYETIKRAFFHFRAKRIMQQELERRREIENQSALIIMRALVRNRDLSFNLRRKKAANVIFRSLERHRRQKVLGRLVASRQHKRQAHAAVIAQAWREHRGRNDDRKEVIGQMEDQSKALDVYVQDKKSSRKATKIMSNERPSQREVKDKATWSAESETGIGKISTHSKKDEMVASKSRKHNTDPVGGAGRDRGQPKRGRKSTKKPSVDQEHNLQCDRVRKNSAGNQRKPAKSAGSPGARAILARARKRRSKHANSSKTNKTPSSFTLNQEELERQNEASKVLARTFRRFFSSTQPHHHHHRYRQQRRDNRSRAEEIIAALSLSSSNSDRSMDSRSFDEINECFIQ